MKETTLDTLFKKYSQLTYFYPRRLNICLICGSVLFIVCMYNRLGVLATYHRHSILRVSLKVINWHVGLVNQVCNMYYA